MSETTVLIVEDHPVFVEGFAAMLQRSRPGWRLRSAGCAADALSMVAAARPDVVVSDIVLPGIDGFALLDAFASRWPDLPVIFVSGRDQANVRVRARASGARGFLPKVTPAGHMVAAIETVIAGGTAFMQGEASGEDIPALTPRQAQILDLLAEGHGNKEIRYRLDIAERTVRAHLTELFHVLGAHSRMQAVVRARELGLIA
jgi:DNA-binding NarL/FixJ family response regulator